jgi:hypothetical protein
MLTRVCLLKGVGPGAVNRRRNIRPAALANSESESIRVMRSVSYRQ